MDGVKANYWSLLLVIVWLIYLGLIVEAHLWGYVGVPHMTPLFADLYAVLSAADCYTLGYDVFKQNPCDIYFNRVHVYPSVWLVLGNIGLTVRDTFWLGVALNTAFILVVTLLLKPKSASEFAFSVLFVLSPVMILAMERANNDLLVFFLLCLSALLVARYEARSSLPGILPAFVATLLKIYPIAAMLIIPLFSKTSGRFVRDLVLVTVLLCMWAPFGLNELFVLKTIVPRPEGPYAFGATLLFKYLGLEWHKFIVSLVLASIMLLSALRIANYIEIHQDLSKCGRQSVLLFCMGYAVLIFSFLANTNFDYRCIFLALLVPWLLAISRAPGIATRGIGRRSRLLGIICLTFMVLVAWSEAFVASLPLVLSHLSRPDRLSLSPEFVRTFLRLTEHLLTWLLMFFLTIIFFKTFLIQQCYVFNCLSRKRSTLSRTITR